MARHQKFAASRVLTPEFFRWWPRGQRKRWSLAVLALSVLAAGSCGDESSAPPAPETGEPDTALPESDSAAPPDGSAMSGTLTPEGASPEQQAGLSGDLGWEALESIAFDSSDQRIQLSGGRATVSYGGASADEYTLQNRVAVGDLDGDGDDDVAVQIVEQSAGTGVFHLIVPVINDDGDTTALPAVSVGDRIVMDSILISRGRVQVSLFDRAPGEPFTVITRHKTLAIDVAGAEPSVQVVVDEPIDDLPLPDPGLQDIDVRFDPGAVSAAVSGSIQFRQRQTYTLQAAAGQTFTATLAAPTGVWLDVRLGDEVIAAAAQRLQRVEAALPAAGPWRVTVVSAHAGPAVLDPGPVFVDGFIATAYAEPADYELTVEALPLGSDPPPPITTAVPPAAAAAPTTTSDAPVPASGSVVYLTFDDGPHPTYTPQVLDTLARHGARATFFVLGSLAESHPDLVERIVAEGHTVANHTWNHENLAGLPHPSFDDTIGRTQAALADHATPCLRPPYGSTDAFTRDWAAALGLDLVLWTVDTNDWRRPGARVVADRIVRGATNEAIMLMHDGGGNRTQTVDGLDLALDRLSERGLRYEPVCM